MIEPLIGRRTALASLGGIGLAALAGRAQARLLPLGPGLAAQILNNANFTTVLAMAKALLASGLKAGTSYPEVWIRDTNTFIELALQSTDRGVLRSGLLNFFELQGDGGDIVDGYAPATTAVEPAYRTSPKLPGVRAHKNTVESDQESSLVSCVRKYVAVTGDTALLSEQVRGVAVQDRLRRALEYILTERFDHKLGLIWQGTTVDWGDVQPETYPGTHLNAQSHRSCGIYANAMAIIAIGDYLKLSGGDARLAARRDALRRAVRTHLWDDSRGAPIPHVYLEGSPFPPSVDERAMYYHGGTAIAIEAGLLSRVEVARTLGWMRANVRAAGANSIGLTVYSPYPAGTFKDPILREPYTYQNGGDWDWFGGRMVQQLIRLGMVRDAYVELLPMVDRIVRAGAFYEWWSLKGEPRGSAGFKGGAGVIGLAIQQLRARARAAL